MKKRIVTILFILVSFLFAGNCNTVHLQRYGKYGNIGITDTDMMVIQMLKINPEIASQKFEAIAKDGLAQLFFKNAS